MGRPINRQLILLNPQPEHQVGRGTLRAKLLKIVSDGMTLETFYKAAAKRGFDQRRAKNVLRGLAEHGIVQLKRYE